MELSTCIEIKSESDIIEARKIGRSIAKKIGFNHVEQARIVSVISELARNIYLYVGNGTTCVKVIDDHPSLGLRITAIDDGVGITNIGDVIRVGYAGLNELGTGLSGIRQLVDEFDIYTEHANGTQIVVVKWIGVMDG